MKRKCILLIGVMVFWGSATVRADDAADALAQWRRAFTSQAKIVQGTFERRNGVWQVVEFGLSSEHITDVDLERLATLKAVEGLGLDGTRQITAHGLRQIEQLRHLRQLAIYWQLNAMDLPAIAAIPHLEDLNLSTYGHETRQYEGLASLTHLRQLNLAGIGLDDSSIQYLKSLVALQELNLARNEQLTDKGLAYLQGLRDLQALDLSETDKISDAGLKKLTNLANLKTLKLGYGKGITDNGITHLKDLQNLRFLDVSRIGPVGVNAIGDLPLLEHVSIGAFVPGDAKPGLSPLRSLRWLEIGHVEGKNPGQVDLPINLQRLHLLNSTAPRLNLQSATNIENVKIWFNRSFSDHKPQNLTWLGSIPELRELTLAGWVQSDVMAVAELSQLRTLNLEGQQCVSAIGDKGMRALGRLQNLESLRIVDWYDGGNETMEEVNAGLDALTNLKNLQRLKLQGFSKVTSRSLASIRELKQLRVLNLSLYGGQLDASLDDTLTRMKGLTELEELSLSFYRPLRLTDDGLKSLADLKKLRRLDLGTTSGYSDDALASLMRALPNLQILKRTYTHHKDAPTLPK
jgi:hypothetical protein